MPSSSTNTRANGSVSVWPGYCTGVTIAKLVIVPAVREVDLALGPELDARRSGSSRGRRRRPARTSGNADAEQPVVLRCGHRAVGEPAAPGSGR